MEERLNELERKIENNYNEILSNMNKLHNHEEKINRNTGALDVLNAIKSFANKFFLMWVITMIVLIVSLCVNFYLLNDTTTIQTETTQKITQQNDNGSNNYVGNDGDITNGKAND